MESEQVIHLAPLTPGHGHPHLLHELVEAAEPDAGSVDPVAEEPSQLLLRDGRYVGQGESHLLLSEVLQKVGHPHACGTSIRSYCLTSDGLGWFSIHTGSRLAKPRSIFMEEFEGAHVLDREHDLSQPAAVRGQARADHCDLLERLPVFGGMSCLKMLYDIKEL